MTHFVINAFRYNVTLFSVFYYFITVLVICSRVPSLLILFQALVIVFFVICF